MFLGASGHLFEMARKLRRQETQAEKLLWSKVSSNQLGAKFRRQHLYTITLLIFIVIHTAW